MAWTASRPICRPASKQSSWTREGRCTRSRELLPRRSSAAESPGRTSRSPTPPARLASRRTTQTLLGDLSDVPARGSPGARRPPRRGERSARAGAVGDRAATGADRSWGLPHWRGAVAQLRPRAAARGARLRDRRVALPRMRGSASRSRRRSAPGRSTRRPSTSRSTRSSPGQPRRSTAGGSILLTGPRIAAGKRPTSRSRTWRGRACASGSRFAHPRRETTARSSRSGRTRE
jgi:hypothetical protein